MIYADNAATTQLDEEALKAMMPYLKTEYGNASEPYAFARPAKRALKESREIIASCINADPDEIFFTSGGTESDNWAIKGIMIGTAKEHELITTSIEHHAILNSAATIERVGFSVIYLPVNSIGQVLPEVLKSNLSSRTKIVSIMLSNNEIGTIQPIKELAKIAHSKGVLFHTDAVQAVGHIPIDVRELGVDMLSASAHKFNGPKGIGFLYIKKGTPLNSYADGGAQELGMRAGTENIPAIVGMAIALKRNCADMDANIKHILSLESSLMNRLDSSNLEFKRNGGVNKIPGNISLSFRNFEGEMILHRLDLKGICVSTGSACDSKNTQISHVLKAIGLQEDYAKGTIRISLGKYNTIEDVDTIANVLVGILTKRYDPVRCK